ncbi:MAG: Ig-like domain-containing protein, partial [Gemmatimonadota bacterium]
MGKNLFFALAIVVFSLSCDDSPPPVTGPDPGLPPVPQGFYALQKISGDGQTGAPGEPLADPYVVKVVDEFGGAVPDATVRFQILDNVGGSLTASSVVTDEQGDAYVTARLPNDPDATQSVLARMDSATNELTFTSRTTLAASGASTIRIVSGNGQQGPTGDSLPAPLIVEVSNTDGVAVPGVSVKWRVTSPNGGAVRETPTLTDGQGLASNSWRLGDLPGATDQVIAWIEPANAPPDTVVFSAEVTAGPTDIRIVSGNGQTGITLDTLPDRLVVEVTDPEGISVPGVRVNWSVISSSGGSIRESPTFTDTL